MATASGNTLTYLNPEIWSAAMQPTYFKESVALGFANTQFQSELSMGDKVNFPYGSYPRVQTYTTGTDITVKDISSTNDYLEVATAKVAPFYVDFIDKVQNKYDAVKEWSTFAMRQLNNTLDQAVMAEYSNAGSTVDNGDLTGSGSAAIALSTSNVGVIPTIAGRMLNDKNRTSPDRFWLVGPRTLELLQQYVGGRETGFGDTVSDNGKVANRYGFGIYLTNNLPFTAVFDMDTILTAADTVTIAGVVFTACANGAASGAGGFSIGTTADTCNTSLTAAINDSGTPGVTTYIALSAEDRQTLESHGIAAVADLSANTLTITGYGDITVATSNSASALWSAQVQYGLMGVRGAIHLLTQKAPTVAIKDAPYRLGVNVYPHMLYGKKTFTRNANSLVNVKIDASAWL